jgi:hypothetical protein
MAGVVPAEYQPQMLWQMACCERNWCDFVSFDPRLPKHLQLFQIRFKADSERIRAMEAEVQKFLEEVETALNCLPQRRKANRAGAAVRREPANHQAGRSEGEPMKKVGHAWRSGENALATLFERQPRSQCPAKEAVSLRQNGLYVAGKEVFCYGNIGAKQRGHEKPEQLSMVKSIREMEREL